MAPTQAAIKTGYLFDEIFMWHDPGQPGNTKAGYQRRTHFEHEETKRRFNNLVHVSGMINEVVQVKARPATIQELCRVHTPRYVDYIRSLSEDDTKGTHVAGHELSFAPGAYDIAALAAGGAIELVDAALDGAIDNGYGLVRPPGHHATPDAGMGYCIFNNVAIAAKHALEARGLTRVAVVDYDVHHGNGTQAAFWSDPRVLVISLHQDSNYPIASGPITEVGAGPGEGTTLNIPLPPGSGSGAYRAAFDRAVIPALDAFRPQLILVSSGFDAAFLDPLASQMCTSADYAYFTAALRAAADRHCRRPNGSSGALVMLHEGGYSPAYVPFCGLAVLEALSGRANPKGVVDPFLEDAAAWGYQGLQAWQAELLERVEAGPLALLRQRCAAAVVPAAAVAAGAAVVVAEIKAIGAAEGECKGIEGGAGQRVPARIVVEVLHDVASDDGDGLEAHGTLHSAGLSANAGQNPGKTAADDIGDYAAEGGACGAMAARQVLGAAAGAGGSFSLPFGIKAEAVKGKKVKFADGDDVGYEAEGGGCGAMMAREWLLRRNA